MCPPPNSRLSGSDNKTQSIKSQTKKNQPLDCESSGRLGLGPREPNYALLLALGDLTLRPRLGEDPEGPRVTAREGDLDLPTGAVDRDHLERPAGDHAILLAVVALGRNAGPGHERQREVAAIEPHAHVGRVTLQAHGERVSHDVPPAVGKLLLFSSGWHYTTV